MLVDLDMTEREELIQLVENYLADTRVERRRTRTAAYREKVRGEELLLQKLLEKLRQV